VLNGTSDVIVVLDQAGDVMLLNPAATRYFKVQADEVIGRPVADLGISDLRAALVAARGSDGPITREIEVDADHTLYASVSPVEGVGWVMVMQDISSLKELDRLRTEWVAAVSHDLKNPITSLQMAVGLLAKSDTLTDSQRNLLAAMRRSSERLRTLVTDVLDLASLEAGPGLRAASLRPTSVIADAVAEVKRLAEDKEITLATDLAPSLPNVRGDAALLARALVNLLSNAIKYTQSGGRVTLRAAPQDGMVRVAVEDTGRGIPAEAIPHLFERFYRVPGSEDEAEGTGLGLSIVKSVVEKHGGDVMVESEVGQGSTFAFTVPICQQEVCE
jgi:PAS domain S-box-containing protein